MTENEVSAVISQWENDGFKFIGNGFENNEDDPNRCPKCDSEYIFWALWEHPTKRRNLEDDTEYKPLLLNSINHCYDCDHRWIDRD